MKIEFNRIPQEISSKGGSWNAKRWEKKKISVEEPKYSTFMDLGGYREKSDKLSYEYLKYIAINTAPIAAIINTRVNQIGAFTKPARFSDTGLGFKIRLKDKNIVPTKVESDEMEQLEDFISKCGKFTDRKRDNFDTFLRKVMRDSLIYDQLNFEMVQDSNGKIVAFYPVDASTIRVATGEKVEDAYVQVLNGEVVAGFTEDEMAMAIRNPRTDIYTAPYGLSEIELIVKQLSSYIEAEDYNMRFFQQGGMTKGILNIKQDPAGVAGQGSLESFKRQWRTQVTGQTGAWKIPVFQLPGEVEFINISQSGGEMVFEKWVNYLINISCAVYGIDPAEINFPNNGGVGGNGGGIFEGNNEAKYKNSRNKGLYPTLQFIENTINTHIISKFSDKYVFVFDGMNDLSYEARTRLDKEKTNTYLTVNELRQEKGLEPIKGGDVILNPYYMQSLGLGDSEDGGFQFEEES